MQMSGNERARLSAFCGCGKRKRIGYSFCGSCFFSLPEEMQPGMKSKEVEVRDRTYEAAYKVLSPIWPAQATLREVVLSEEQMTALFLASRIDGKRVAIQALLDWERSPLASV